MNWGATLQEAAKFPSKWLGVLTAHLVITPIHWMMERKMLLTLKERAEKTL